VIEMKQLYNTLKITNSSLAKKQQEKLTILLKPKEEEPVPYKEKSKADEMGEIIWGKEQYYKMKRERELGR